MHGGAYVGGDKNDCRDYLEYLCSDTQQIIVNIDYERSPEAKHPTPVIQLNEAIQAAKKEIKDQADWSKSIVFVGHIERPEYRIGLLCPV